MWENLVDFCVSDDGIGFDTQQQQDGMGLDSMRERAEGLDGIFSLQSEPRQGTKVWVTFPID
jgi:two-component system sensor histidine kinase NreB